VAWEASQTVSKTEGTYVSPRKSPTVEKAGEDWIAASEAAGLERATLKQYREHLRLHIAPYIGTVKLSAQVALGFCGFRRRLGLNEDPRR
jgi:hypothetical protein